MVRTRVLIGVCLAAVFAGLLVADGMVMVADGPILYGVVGLLMVASLLEFCSLARQGGDHPRTIKAVVLMVAAVVIQFLAATQAWPGLGERTPGGMVLAFYPFVGAMATVSFVLLAVDQLMWRHPERYLHDLSVTALGFFYVWLLGAHILAIRSRWGTACVVTLLVAAKLGDIGAYFTGTFFGRHKLVPRISPNKTIEGSIGGIIAAAAGAVLVAVLLVRPPLAVGFWIVFGLVIGVAGQVGDLVESAIKRSVGAKDSNQLLPAFGGVLDVVDSILFGAPAALWLLELWGRYVLTSELG